MARTQISFEPDGSEIWRLRFLGTDFISLVENEEIIGEDIKDQFIREMAETINTFLDDFDHDELFRVVDFLEDEDALYKLRAVNKTLNYCEETIFEEARKL